MLKTIWQPPRLYSRIDRAEGEIRRVTWLELFYDLVYVATIVQLGNILSDDVSVGGFVRFAGLFFIVWWSWVGITLYMNRFVSDDLLHRILVFTQMFGIAVAALSVQYAFGSLSTQFALAYALIRALLVIMYLRAGQHAPDLRPMTYRFAALFGFGTTLFVISAFVPQPFMFVLWAIAALVEFLTPPSPLMRPFVADKYPPHTEHMAERFGLFTIIVLGESFLKTIGEEAGTTITFEALVFSIFGLIVTYSIWWLYFDDVAEAEIRPGRWTTFTWLYTHMPLQLGITMFGVAAVKLFAAPLYESLYAPYRMLFCTALVIYLVFIGVIDYVTHRHDRAISNQTRAVLRFGAAAIMVAVAILGSGMSTLAVILIAAVLFAGQVMVDLREPRHRTNTADADV